MELTLRFSARKVTPAGAERIMNEIDRRWPVEEREGQDNVPRLTLSPFSLSTFPVCGLRVLRSMQETAGRAEDRTAPATGFHVGFTQVTATVRALRARRS